MEACCAQVERVTAAVVDLYPGDRQAEIGRQRQAGEERQMSPMWNTSYASGWCHPEACGTSRHI